MVIVSPFNCLKHIHSISVYFCRRIDSLLDLSSNEPNPGLGIAGAHVGT
jgi:hypothetical protein